MTSLGVLEFVDPLRESSRRDFLSCLMECERELDQGIAVRSHSTLDDSNWVYSFEFSFNHPRIPRLEFDLGIKDLMKIFPSGVQLTIDGDLDIWDLDGNYQWSATADSRWSPALGYYYFLNSPNEQIYVKNVNFLRTLRFYWDNLEYCVNYRKLGKLII